MYTNVWDDTKPTGSEAANTIDDIFRALKLDIDQRITDIFAMPSMATDPLRPYGIKFTDAQDSIIYLGDNSGTPRSLIVKDKTGTNTYASFGAMGTISTSLTVTSTIVPPLTANSAIVDFYSSISRLIGVGPNSSTKGSLQLIVSDTSGSTISGIIIGTNGATIVDQYLCVGNNSGGTGTVGDIVARRSSTTGAYYFGDSANASLIFDGTNYNFGVAGGVNVNNASAASYNATIPTVQSWSWGAKSDTYWRLNSGLNFAGADLIVAQPSGLLNLSSTTIDALGVGVTSLPNNVALYISGTNPSGTSSQYSLLTQPTFGSAATVTAVGIFTQVSTAATTFTCAEAVGIQIASTIKGSGSTITNNVGLVINSQTVGTNNYAILTQAGLVNFGDTVLINQSPTGNELTGTLTIGSATVQAGALQTNKVLGQTIQVTNNGTNVSLGAQRVYFSKTALGTTDGVTAFQGFMDMAATSGTAIIAIGLQGIAQSSAVGSTIDTMVGVRGQAGNDAGGTVLNAMCVDANPYVINGGTAPTNLYGYYCHNIVAGTNNFAIFCAGANDVMLNGSGAQLSSSATVGFLYIPNMSGPALALPANIRLGATPVFYDTARRKLTVYDTGLSAWIGALCS